MAGEREEIALALGRHYVAGNLEAEALDERLGTAYQGEDPSLALAGLPDAPAADYVPEVRRTSWWRRRHGEGERVQPDWMPTGERFVDPTTQRVMRVWLEPRTRTRHYVAEHAG